jgi:hypothetical protein
LVVRKWQLQLQVANLRANESACLIQPHANSEFNTLSREITMPTVLINH